MRVEPPELAPTSMRLCFKIGRVNALALLVSAWSLSSSAQVAQPAGPLNLYSPAETPEDDLQLSRAADFGHLRMGAQLQVDYANNPLVWEDALGSSDSERYVVVRHHMVSTLGLSLGLWERAVVYAGLPATVWVAGDSAEALAPRLQTDPAAPHPRERAGQHGLELTNPDSAPRAPRSRSA